jgi:hypothetical protein
MQRTVRWLALGVLGFVAASACSEQSGSDDVIGFWDTKSVAGYSVPGKIEYVRKSHDTQYIRWVFYDGGQCTLTQHVDGGIDTYDECEYTVNVEQHTLTMTFQYEKWAGRLDGNRLVFTDPKDVEWILRRQ